MKSEPAVACIESIEFMEFLEFVELIVLLLPKLSDLSKEGRLSFPRKRESRRCPCESRELQKVTGFPPSRGTLDSCFHRNDRFLFHLLSGVSYSVKTFVSLYIAGLFNKKPLNLGIINPSNPINLSRVSRSESVRGEMQPAPWQCGNYSTGSLSHRDSINSSNPMNRGDNPC